MIKFKLIILFFLTLISNSLLSQNYADSLNFYYQKKDFSKAIIFGEKLETDTSIIKNKLNLISIKSNNGVIYYSLEEYQLARKKFEEALLLSKNETAITDTEKAIIKKQASRNLKELREFDEAKKLIYEALETFKSQKGKGIGNYADALRLLGDIFKSEGKIEKAISIIKESSEIFKEVFGENEYYSYAIGDLGECYFLIEDYNNAELLYTKSIEIQKRLKSNLSHYALSLGNLADIYIVKKQYVEAETILFEADEILRNEEKYSLKHLEILDKLGNLYSENKMYDNAEILFKLSISLKEKKYGKYHSNVLAIKNNLALVYFKKKNFEMAKEIYLEILNTHFIENNDEYNVINNLGLVYTELKKYEESVKLYLKALENIEKSNLNQSSKHLILLENLSILYLKIGKGNLANKHIINQLDFVKNLILKFNLFFTAFDLTNYINGDYESIYFPYSFLQSHPTQYPEINIGCYENELLLKNLSLRNQQRIKTTIEKKGDAVVKEKYQQFIDNKRYLTKLDELPIAQRPKEYDLLKTDTENLEKELTRISSTFADSKKSLSITWKQIQEKLQPNEVAIDLVLYNFYNKKWTDSIMYGAFVVKKDSKFPKYIPLFEQKQLKFLMERNSKDENTIQVRKLNKQYSDKAISELFLKPLEKELQGISTIYLSPSGLGHQIDFSALPVSETQTLGDKYAVHILGSTSEIVNYKVTHLDQKTKLELLLYGDIDYNKSETTSIATNDTIENNCDTEFAGLATRSGITKWNYLIGTKKEVEQIKIVGQQNGFSTKIMNERNATEESIKHLDGRITPYVLHLATHGFFFPDPKQELPKEDLLSDSKSKIYKTAEDPMMRSGLLFAGANRYWGKPTENITTDDGILTANEISNLDLSSCQLVVMSSCETGLGDINGSEGVFGLQRAFKMAGVKNIIMSLWKVPDIETAELFDVFYTECLAGKTIHEAFQTAQAKMKLKYSPYYWAGFVLLE